jgi:hypothetical protein
MINPEPFRSELLDLLRARSEAARAGRSSDRFRFSGAREAVQTADMLTETEKTAIWRRRSNIYQADRLAQEIGL